MPDWNNAKKEPFIEGKTQANYGDGLTEHVVNFLDCIRKGGKLNAPVEVGAKTAIVSEMGNIAYPAQWKRESQNNFWLSFILMEFFFRHFYQRNMHFKFHLCG
jgi:hypothetical protein